MMTVLATLPFLAALAVAAIVIVGMLQENGGKMLAALRGESLLATPVLSTRPVVVRMSSRPQRVTVRPTVRKWRAAA